MQNFNKFNDSDYISDAPDKLNDNFQSIASDFAGTSFPTTDLVEGMSCYRTDEGIEYRYVGGKWVAAFATQAEAEAGTDNTKIMTPKGVDYRLNKDRKLKTYTSVWDFSSLDTNITFAEIYEKLTGASFARFYINADFINLQIPTNHNYHLLCYKQNSVVVMYLEDYTDTKLYIGKCTASSFSGWKRLATNGALSMPSGGTHRISISLNSVVDTNGVTDSTYVAPADGWIFGAFTPYSKTAVSRMSITVGAQWDIGVNKTLINVPDKGRLLYPVAKGNNVTIQTINTTDVVAYFYYAQSEV